MSIVSRDPDGSAGTSAYVREALLFKELLYVSQQALTARLTGEECPDAGNLLVHLFGAGRACGLAEKVVVQALLEPVKAHLRRS